MMGQEIINPAKPARPTSIKGLTPRLPERGKIKLGHLGDTRKSKAGNPYQLPVKDNYFTITKLDRDESGNFTRDHEIHAMLGNDQPTDIPVRLLYDDIELNMPICYACYIGKTLWCRGDGESAMRLDANNEYKPCQCPCPRKEPTYIGQDKCKMNGALSVLIDGAGGLGGVWTFRTTSFNSITGIISSLSFLKTVTAGILANLPLRLTVRPKQVTLPTDPTKSATVYIAGIEFRGTMSDLQQSAQKMALERATNHVRIDNIEHEARRLLLAAPITVPLEGDDNEEIVQEFYPEQIENIETFEQPPRPTRSAPVPAQPAPNTPPVLTEVDRPQPAESAPHPGLPPFQDGAAAAKPKIELVNWDGEIFYANNAGHWLDLLLDKLNSEETKNAIGVWETNYDLFIRIQGKAIRTNEAELIKQCKIVADRAAELMQVKE